MAKKQIKAEFSKDPNSEVDILRSTLAEVKVKLPGLDAFLLANPECTKCSNSKAYHCVQHKGKPGCRTCSSRRISCSRHVQYLVETTASRLEWTVEKTKSMYDKYVKQTRSGSSKNSIFKVKRMPTQNAMDAPQTIGSGSTAVQTVVESRGGRRNVTAPEEDDYEGEGGSDYQDGVQQALKDLENVSDDPEEDDQDIEWNENSANNIPHSISNATLRLSSSKPHPSPSDPQEEIPTFIIPVLEPEEAASLDLGLHDPTSRRTEPEKMDAVPRMDVLTQFQLENERNGTAAAVSGAQSEHTPESSMSAEQRIKQLEEKVAKLKALRLVDAASISRLAKRADTAFDNMSVLLSHVRMYRQELGTIVSKHIETEHQKPFKPLIDKMDETSVSATQILMLLDKRKNYVMPKTRVPVIIIDEEGQEWVPWDVISDDNDLRDTETETKRSRDNGAKDEGSSKRRKC